VDRSVQGVDRAARKLVGPLASDDDAVVHKALDALVRRLHPPAAASYPGEALGRSKGDSRPRRRVAMALTAIGRRVREPATTTLIGCLLKERDEGFAGHLLACLCELGPAPGGPD
jgi:hypothetical protein